MEFRVGTCTNGRRVGTGPGTFENTEGELQKAKSGAWDDIDRNASSHVAPERSRRRFTRRKTRRKLEIHDGKPRRFADVECVSPVAYFQRN